MKKPSSSGLSSACQPLKKAEEDKATIVWVDLAGFYLLPMAVRTWAPRGQTPVLRVKLARDHLSAISSTQLRSSKAVLVNMATRFSSLVRDQ
jgi:hypothetical protein